MFNLVVSECFIVVSMIVSFTFFLLGTVKNKPNEIASFFHCYILSRKKKNFFL